MGDHVEVLGEGDSIYYNSATPHGMIAVYGHDCLFCAVVMPGEEVQEQSVRESIVSGNRSDRLACEKFVKATENENGVLTASEERSGASLPADAALLTALQNVIDEYDLAQFNGVYRVTAGLPPEFQERTLRVEYASGETLSFTENNEPEALWAERFYEVFADWFAANGDESLRPAKETSLLTRLDLRANTKLTGIECSELAC